MGIPTITASTHAPPSINIASGDDCPWETRSPRSLASRKRLLPSILFRGMIIRGKHGPSGPWLLCERLLLPILPWEDISRGKRVACPVKYCCQDDSPPSPQNLGNPPRYQQGSCTRACTAIYITNVRALELCSRDLKDLSKTKISATRCSVQ